MYGKVSTRIPADPVLQGLVTAALLLGGERTESPRWGWEAGAKTALQPRSCWN